jgi:CDP-diacylglycerol--glycerol-3-phosphate 3-phosphatidyltransferase
MLMKNKPNKKASNLPNILTIIRLACIPFVVVFLNFPGELGSFLAALCVGFAFITDMLDGFFARRFGAVTVLGKFLDPLADKILVCVTMIMLIPMDRIPLWMVVVIIVREMSVTGLRSIAINEGVVIQAGALGKYKTIFQSVALLGLCLHYEHFNINFHVVGIVFLWGALALTVWSGWDYFRQFKQVLLSANR